MILQVLRNYYQIVHDEWPDLEIRAIPANLGRSHFRYLNEVGSTNECMELIECGLQACEDKESLWYAHLSATAASIETERAHTECARKYYDDAIRIRERRLPPDDCDLANIYSSFANMILTEYLTAQAPDEAIALYQKAISIDEKIMVGYEYNCALFIRNINLGFALGCLEEYDSAIEKMKLARSHALAALGDGSHWDAE